MLPDPVQGFVHRPRLAAACDLLAHRLTLVQAPAGFGKTVLLADVCRRLRERAVLTAWLSVEEDDGPSLLGSYLQLAVAEAGLELVDNIDDDPGEPDYLVNRLIHNIEQNGKDSVLVIDEADRLVDQGSLKVLERLLHQGPPNLHMALAFRSYPAGFDVATLLFEGRGAAIDVEQLRFDKSEIARFFDTGLSRQELAVVAKNTSGWPIALCIQRNLRRESGVIGAEDLAANWIETRLWRGMPAEDRQLIARAGLFEWFDAELLDQALSRGSMRRLRAMPALRGLLQSAGDAAVLRLHPLVRTYCSGKLLEEEPELYRSIHASIAECLAARGDAVHAVRHAWEADDIRLAGRILEDAGGVRLWLRQGKYALKKVGGYLNDEIVAANPRLALMRCVALAIEGDLDRSRQVYARAHALTGGFAGNRDGGGLDLQCEALVVKSCFALYACEPMGSPGVQGLMEEYDRLLARDDVDPVARSTFLYAKSCVHYALTDFGAAAEFGLEAREQARPVSRFVSLFAELQLGAIAMAEGRQDDARGAYARGQATAKRNFYRDGTPSLLADVMMMELDLETNRAQCFAGRLHNPELLAANGAWLDIFVASADTASELALRKGDGEGALAPLKRGLEFAKDSNRGALRTCLAAVYASMLVETGRAAEAEQVWADEGLPRDIDECLDWSLLGWRGMEAIACARVRLLVACADLDAAAKLARALVDTAISRRMRRTLSWALALTMSVEWRRGRRAEARSRLLECLGLFAGTGYLRALLRERDQALEVSRNLDVEQVEPQLRQPLAVVLRVLEESAGHRADGAPIFTERELDVLQRLEHFSDKEIAAAFDLTEDGVRYHVKKIFRKLKVGNRIAAAVRAREAGILPPGSLPLDSLPN